MSYYFTNDPQLEMNRKNINFRFFGVIENFISDNGVFSKETLDYGSRALLETITKLNITGKVLDMGCGIGVIGILLKKYKSDIDLTLIDVNERAVELTKINSQNYKQDNKVILSDGFAALDDKFDCIVSNPPIRIGKEKLYSLFTQAYEHLNENGMMYLVIRKQQGAKSAMTYLAELGLKVELLNKDKGYWIISAKNS